MAGGDDVWSQVLWRSVSARVLARQGTIDEAETLARESLGLATATDSLQLQGEASLGLAEVLQQGGRVVEAARATEDAIAMFQRKGEVQAVRRASTRLQRLNA